MDAVKMDRWHCRRLCVQKSVCKVYILVLVLCIIKDLVEEMLKYVFIVNYSSQSGVFNWRPAACWGSGKTRQEVPNLDLNKNVLKMLIMGQGRDDNIFGMRQIPGKTLTVDLPKIKDQLIMLCNLVLLLIISCKYMTGVSYTMWVYEWLRSQSAFQV